MKIGIFDSGIGGLTVLKELVYNHPNYEYIYVGDTLNVPYGNKTREQLLKLSYNIIDYLINKNVDIIIIACGTISSNISKELKNKYKIPIIDIISPTINYLKNSKYYNIGIIATNMTIKSNIFKHQLNNKNIIQIPCPKLVPAIESNNLIDIENSLNEYLSNFIKNKIDILVLGCTHYPIVTNEIKNILPNISLLNMAYPINKMIKDGNNNLSVTINFTKINNDIINNTNKILKHIKYETNLIKIS